MNFRLSAALASALFATPCLAQEGALVVKTGHEEIAADLADSFGSMVDLPSLEPGSHYVMTLDDGGRIAVDTAPGDVGLLRLRARPGQLMEIFTEEIAQARQMAQGMGTFVLSQQGIQAREAMQLIQGLFEFPKQIDVVDLRVDGDPDRPEQGFEGSLSLTPAAGTWFAKMVSSLKPARQGAPVLGGGGMLTMRAAVDGLDVEVLRPLLRFVAAQGARSKEQVAKQMALMESLLKNFDGTLAMDWSSEGMRTVYGLRDPQAAIQLMQDPAYRKWTEAQAKTNPMAEVDIDFEAFEHNGVKVARTTVTMDEFGMGQNPLMKDGKMETFQAVAGTFLVSVMGAGEEVVRSLIDTALDGKIERKPLPGGKLMVLHMALADFADQMSGGMAPVEEMPEQVDLGLKVAQGALVFEAKVR